MATEQAAKLNKNAEKIFAEFQTLRNEQRNLINTLSTHEMNLKEHKTVIDTLKTVDEDRKCYRLIGGVLCARTVKEVLPALTENRDQLEKYIAMVKEQITNKGHEINKFREDNNIKIRGQEAFIDKSEQQPAAGESADKKNVLVGNY